MNAGGSATRSAAERALNGTELDQHEFIRNGQHVARIQDERVAASAYLPEPNKPLTEVGAAVQVALAGPPSYVTDFLQVGRFKAARKDQDTATHVAGWPVTSPTPPRSRPRRRRTRRRHSASPRSHVTRPPTPTVTRSRPASRRSRPTSTPSRPTVRRGRSASADQAAGVGPAGPCRSAAAQRSPHGRRATRPRRPRQSAVQARGVRRSRTGCGGSGTRVRDRRGQGSGRGGAARHRGVDIATNLRIAGRTSSGRRTRRSATPELPDGGSTTFKNGTSCSWSTASAT